MTRLTMGLVAAWVVLLVASQARDLLPASWWFDPGTLAIEDTVRGACPPALWSREIRRPFAGRWTAAVQRYAGGAEWRHVATFSGAANYRPDAALPRDLSLAWFLGIDRQGCDWPPGEYRVVTSWEIRPASGPPRRAAMVSAPFQIMPSLGG